MLLAILLVPFFGDSDPWPFQRLSDLQLGYQKVTIWITWLLVFSGVSYMGVSENSGFPPQIIPF